MEIAAINPTCSINDLIQEHLKDAGHIVTKTGGFVCVRLKREGQDQWPTRFCYINTLDGTIHMTTITHISMGDDPPQEKTAEFILSDPKCFEKLEQTLQEWRNVLIS